MNKTVGIGLIGCGGKEQTVSAFEADKHVYNHSSLNIQSVPTTVCPATSADHRMCAVS